MLLLAHKRRLFALIQVIRAYEHLLAKSRGETTEVMQPPAHLNADKAMNSAILKAGLGKEPRLHSRIDRLCWVA